MSKKNKRPEYWVERFEISAELIHPGMVMDIGHKLHKIISVNKNLGPNDTVWVNISLRPYNKTKSLKNQITILARGTKVMTLGEVHNKVETE